MINTTSDRLIFSLG